MNQHGHPSSPGCIVCLAVQIRMEPQLSFQEWIAKLRDPPYEAYQSEVNRGRIAVEEEQEANSNRTLPIFVPGFNVSQSARYGYSLSVKCAALSETEIVSATKKTPASLGLTPWQTEWVGPDQKAQLYLVSLRDLPDELKHTCRRVKIWHEVEASREKLQLSPSTMLSANQHHSAFQHATNSFKSQRPAAQVESLQTLPQLIDLAQRVDNELQAKMAAAGDEAAGRKDQQEKPKILAGLESGMAPPPTKRPKRAAKPPLALTGPADEDPIPIQGTDSNASTGTGPDEEMSEVGTVASGGSGSKKGKMDAAEYAALDPDMKKVASVHFLNGNRNASAKCLLWLTHTTFLSKDSAKQRERGQCISSVARQSISSVES